MLLGRYGHLREFTKSPSRVERNGNHARHVSGRIVPFDHCELASRNHGSRALTVNEVHALWRAAANARKALAVCLKPPCAIRDVFGVPAARNHLARSFDQDFRRLSSVDGAEHSRIARQKGRTSYA